MVRHSEKHLIIIYLTVEITIYEQIFVLLEITICGTDKDDCHKHATCAHTGPGLYKCTCKKGYTGDGKTCTGLNILICT